MTEIYNSNLEDEARKGLLSLCAEAMSLGDTKLFSVSLEKLQEMDRKDTKQKLGELKTEINNLIK